MPKLPVLDAVGRSTAPSRGDVVLAASDVSVRFGGGVVPMTRLERVFWPLDG